MRNGNQSIHARLVRAFSYSRSGATGQPASHNRRNDCTAVRRATRWPTPIMSRIRKRILLERANAVPEIEPLSIEVHELLYAFDLAAVHVKKGGSYATRLAEQQELALGLIDWAICQTDRGVDLLKAKTRPDEMERR